MSTTERQGIGANLHTLRTEAGISQTALAREMTARGAPLTQQAVDRIERGIRSARVEEAMLAAAILGIPVSGLVTKNADRIGALMRLLRGRVLERAHAARVGELAAELEQMRQVLKEAQAIEGEAQAVLDELGDV